MSGLAALNEQAMRRYRGGSLTISDPVGRITSAQARQSVRPSQPKQSVPYPASFQGPERIADLEAGLRERSEARSGASKPNEQGGLAGKFFNTTIGKGLGVVLNNQIVKTALQPLDILGVPQRMIASTMQEVGDVFAGGGFSGKDWLDQANMDAFIDGNHEGSIGMGDVWRNHGKALGAGDNEWLDAAVGLTGDILTDPLTYLGGVGIATKGLNGVRAGTRLHAAIKGGTTLDKARKVAAGGEAAVAQAVKAGNAAALGGTRASMAGRANRMDRFSEAFQLLDRAENANPGALGQLYGRNLPADAQAALVDSARNEIARRGRAGLSTRGKGVSKEVNDLVETALNVKPSAVRARIPFAKGAGVEVGGSAGRAVAGGLGDALAKPRQAINNSKFGSKAIRAMTPLDIENSTAKLMSPASSMDELGDAAAAYQVMQKARPNAGRYLNLGQREINKRRKKILREAGAKDDAAYLAKAETVGGTELNRMLDFAGNELAAEFGVSVPKLAGDLKYVPHTFSQKFMLKMQSSKKLRAAFRTGMDDFDQNLQAESSSFFGRQLKGGEEIPLEDGQIFKIPDQATIANINEASEKVFGMKILEDKPMALVDNYVQQVSEDVGRRAARAEMVVQGDKRFGYSDDIFEPDTGTTPMPSGKGNEAIREVNSAAERLALQGDDTIAAPRAAKKGQYKAFKEAQKSAAEAEILKNTTAADGNSIARQLGDDKGPERIYGMMEEWKQAGQGIGVVTPEVDNMLRNLAREIRDPKALERAYRAANRFFKTYAVLTPGFHVRNGLSAIFMNSADGVSLKTTVRGMKAWDDFSRAAKNGAGEFDELAGMAHIKKLQKSKKLEDRQIAQALDAVFGSGAGGRFTEAGVAQAGALGGVSRTLLENLFTRGSQRTGAWVEGSVRMGMAMDVIEAGGSVNEAVSRISRVHFDYSQTSRLDDQAKVLIPFWSFVSRNMPLQIMQTWSRPQKYLAYEHLKNNMPGSSVSEEEVPGYIRDGGGFGADMGWFNWLEPDLPHTRVVEDIERYSNVLQDPAAATSNFSPFLTAPIEYAMNRDAFTGQSFDDEKDWEHVSNPLELLAILPATLTGSVKQKDGEFFIQTKTMNALEAMIPDLSRANRMTGVGGREPERVRESWARWLGMPVRSITQKQIDNAKRQMDFDGGSSDRMEQAMLDSMGA
jgi:hypothetical protein